MRGNAPENGRNVNGVQEVHVSKGMLLKAERAVLGSGTERLFEMTGHVRERTASVTGLHEISRGVHLGPNSIEVTDVNEANRDFDGQRGGSAHIGTAHSHTPRHFAGPSPEDERAMQRREGQPNSAVYFLFHDRGEGTMGFQARNTNGARIHVAVHDDDTGRVHWDRPNLPADNWRLESDGNFTERRAA